MPKRSPLGEERTDPEGWRIVIGDGYHFDIWPAARNRLNDGTSDEVLNGIHASRLAAVESVIEAYEGKRRALNAQIARAKRMRRRLAAH